MARGNNGSAIFRSDEDYAMFCRLVEAARQRFNFLVLAYCLMPNHIHLLLQMGADALSDVRQWILGIYAREWNGQQGRYGHVFQGRFLDKLVCGEPAALRVSRYIHRNPTEAGLESKVGGWQWSSMAAYDGNGTDITVDTYLLRKALGGECTAAYRAFVEAAREPSIIGEWYCEEGAFVSPKPPADTASVDEEVVESILVAVCREYGIPAAALRAGRGPRVVTQARKAIAGRLREELKMPLDAIARFVGVASPAAVCYLLRARNS